MESLIDAKVSSCTATLLAFTRGWEGLEVFSAHCQIIAGHALREFARRVLLGTGCVESQSVSVFSRCEFGWLVRVSRFLWRRIPDVGVWATIRRRSAIDPFRTAYHARMWTARQCPMRGVIKTGPSGMEACLLSARRTGRARVAMLITPVPGSSPYEPLCGGRRR